MENAEAQASDVERFTKVVRKCLYPTELMPALLHLLVDKIIIHEKEKDADGHRWQEIEIHYNFVGSTQFSPEYNWYSKKVTA